MTALRTWLVRRVMGRLRIDDDIVRHLSTFQRLGETFDLESPGEMLPIGARTISWAYTAPFVPAFVSSSIVGLHRSGATMRSKPPARNSDATDHHSANDGSCAPCPTSSCSKFAARPFHPLSSQRFTVCGHAPVDPTVAHTPKQFMCRSRRATGTQFAVMWCM